MPGRIPDKLEQVQEVLQCVRQRVRSGREHAYKEDHLWEERREGVRCDNQKRIRERYSLEQGNVSETQRLYQHLSERYRKHPRRLPVRPLQEMVPRLVHECRQERTPSEEGRTEGIRGGCGQRYETHPVPSFRVPVYQRLSGDHIRRDLQERGSRRIPGSGRYHQGRVHRPEPLPHLRGAHAEQLHPRFLRQRIPRIVIGFGEKREPQEIQEQLRLVWLRSRRHRPAILRGGILSNFTINGNVGTVQIQQECENPTMSYNSGDLIQTAQTVLTFIREQCLQQEGVF